MGAFKVRFKVCWRNCVEVEGIVNTGATYAKIPRKILESIGIRPIEKRRFEIGDGRIIERDVGYAIIKVNVNGKEKTCACMVVFGKDDETPLLGATTLEELGLAVDPIRKKLVEITLLEI